MLKCPFIEEVKLYISLIFKLEVYEYSPQINYIIVILLIITYRLYL